MSNEVRDHCKWRANYNMKLKLIQKSEHNQACKKKKKKKKKKIT